MPGLSALSALSALPLLAALVALSSSRSHVPTAAGRAIPGRLVARVWRRVHGVSAERGDIPGWVMIAIMSAAVVSVLIPLVGPTIAHAFTSAVNTVSTTTSSTN